MRVDKYDAEQFGGFHITLQIAYHEKEQHGNPRYFDSGAAGHPVHQVVNEIDKVTAHGQDNKGVHLPETGMGVGRRVRQSLIFGVDHKENIGY